MAPSPAGVLERIPNLSPLDAQGYQPKKMEQNYRTEAMGEKNANAA